MSTLEEVSSKDSLTGLRNRRAYDATCKKLADVASVGVVFCDANGLKSTNDAYGHEAGDRLLISIAKKLTDIFTSDQVYRISGDEFVVMIPNVAEEVFQKQCDELRKLVIMDGMPTVSMGAIHGAGSHLRELINGAEDKMYQDKRMFYEKYPYMERRSR